MARGLITFSSCQSYDLIINLMPQSINFNVGEDRKKFQEAVIANAKTDGKTYVPVDSSVINDKNFEYTFLCRSRNGQDITF